MKTAEDIPNDPKLAEEFWPNVQRGDGCWPFVGGTRPHPAGYGRLYWTFPGQPRRPYLAHRISYRLAYGPIPDGLHVLHSCDNPPCCNPAHLFLGTNDDNRADMVAKGRSARGAKQHGAKLTDAAVLAIRQRVAQGNWSYEPFIREYGVSRTSLYKMITGRTWRHVPDALPNPPKPIPAPYEAPKLTDKQVSEIRMKREAGAKLRELVAEYGVSKAHISEICNRRTRTSAPPLSTAFT